MKYLLLGVKGSIKRGSAESRIEDMKRQRRKKRANNAMISGVNLAAATGSSRLTVGVGVSNW